jgi:hypothetical protein
MNQLPAYIGRDGHVFLFQLYTSNDLADSRLFHYVFLHEN